MVNNIRYYITRLYVRKLLKKDHLSRLGGTNSLFELYYNFVIKQV